MTQIAKNNITNFYFCLFCLLCCFCRNFIVFDLLLLSIDMAFYFTWQKVLRSLRFQTVLHSVDIKMDTDSIFLFSRYWHSVKVDVV